MNKVSITIELCQEDRARLDAISAALGRLAQPQAVNELTGAIEPIGKPEPAAEAEPVKEEPQPAAAAPDPESEAPEAPASKYTKADLQHKVVELSTKGKKGEAREIIQAYGAKLSDVSPDHYDEIMEKLEQLEG